MSECAEAAAGYFASGYNCSQSVLMAFARPLGLDAAMAVRLATGFGLGMARGGTCGAVSGAVMALGLFGGGGGKDGAQAKATTYACVREFYRAFQALHGSLACRELIGLDPSTPEGLATANTECRFQTICLPLVRDAAAIAQRLMTRAAGAACA